VIRATPEKGTRMAGKRTGETPRAASTHPARDLPRQNQRRKSCQPHITQDGSAPAQARPRAASIAGSCPITGATGRGARGASLDRSRAIVVLIAQPSRLWKVLALALVLAGTGH